MTASSVDAVRTHLVQRGCTTPVATEDEGHLETLVRRCDEVRSLGPEFGSIELSPYMQELLRVSRPSAPTGQGTARAAHSLAAVGC